MRVTPRSGVPRGSQRVQIPGIRGLTSAGGVPDLSPYIPSRGRVVGKDYRGVNYGILGCSVLRPLLGGADKYIYPRRARAYIMGYVPY